MAHLHINDASEDWTWWLEVDGANITDPVRMDGTIEAPNEENISMWILIPTNAPAGGLNTITVEVSHEDGIDDQTPQNNALEVIMSTEAVRVPSLMLVNQVQPPWQVQPCLPKPFFKTMEMSGVFADGGRRVSSTPPMPGLIVFFSVEEQVSLSTHQRPCWPCRWFTNTAAEVLLPEDAPLNTRSSSLNLKSLACLTMKAYLSS